MIDTPEVIEAADAVAAKLPTAPVTGNNWGTIGERLDEAMRSKLRTEYGGSVI